MTTFLLIKVISPSAIPRVISELRRYNVSMVTPVSGEFDIVAEFPDYRYVKGIIREVRLIPNVVDVRVLQSVRIGGDIGA